jgi:hypothetical protein
MLDDESVMFEPTRLYNVYPVASDKRFVAVSEVSQPASVVPSVLAIIKK